MTTTPETPAIASTHPATRDGAGKPKAPSALERWVPLASWLRYAEAGYTALSRGRHEQRLYITVDDEFEVDHHRGPEVDDPIEGIRAALHRSERQSSPADNSPPSPRRGSPSVPRSTGANGTPSPRAQPNTAPASTSPGERPI